MNDYWKRLGMLAGGLLAVIFLVLFISMLKSVHENDVARTKDSIRYCERLQASGGADTYKVQLRCKRHGVKVDVK